MFRLGVVVAVLLVGCGTESKRDACAEVSCGDGRCALVGGAAACLCNPGFTASGLSCVATPPADLCSSSPCASLTNSLCQVNSGRVSCVCPSTRVEVSGSCVLRTACVPNPCQQSHRKTCEVLSGEAVCRCDRGFAPEGDGCSLAPVWTCAAQHSDGDAAEPDECPPLAKPLSIDMEETRTLAPLGDHDWFTVGITGGHLFTFSATSTGMPLLIEVFDGDGVTLIASDNRGGAAAEVTFPAPFTQSVMVRVRAVRASDTGAYAVRYRELGVDDYVNTPADAITLVPGGNPFAGTLQYAGDLDVVWLELPAQTAIRLTADGGLSDLVIEVARPDGGVRLLNGGESTTLSTPATESLTLTARARNARSIGAFSVRFEDLGVDDHSDEPAFGTPLRSDGVAVTGRFERSQDIDSFSVAQLTDRLYRARLLGNMYTGQLSVVLETGQVMAGYSSSALVWKADQGRYAGVRVLSSYSSLTSYSVAVDDLGFDDHSDTLSSATPATQGVPVGGRLELMDDIDTFSFTGTAGRVLQVSAASTSPGGGTLHLTAFDQFGQVVGEADGAVGLLVRSTGLHKVTVERASYGSAGDLIPYTVLVTDQGVDDHADTSAGATQLTLGTQASGSLQYAADVDTFAFTAVPNHVYQVACTRGAGSCAFVVKNSTGQTVTSSTYSTGSSFLAATAGRWTVEVTTGSSYSPVLGAFSLIISDLGLEDHGATSATATPLTVGMTMPGAIGFEQDLDMFSVVTQAGHIYSATAPSSGINLQVRDSANVVVASSSYSNGVAFLADDAGPYFISLSSYSVASYSLVVTDRGLDDHGNTAALATALTIGTAASGEIQYQNDLDVFTVPVIAGRHHLVTCAVSGQSCSVTVTSPSGGSIVAGSSSSGLAFKPPAGLTSVVLQVSSSSTFRYSLTVTDLGVDDHGDARADATALTANGIAVAGVLETTVDIDAFTVTASVGEIIALNCVVTARSACSLSVTSPQGTTLINSNSSSTSGFRTGFLAAAAGAYLVQVRGNTYGTGGASFTLAAERGTDDFTTNTAFTAGTARTGSIDYLGDLDTFTIVLTAGVPVRLSLTAARATVSSPTGGYVTTLYGSSINYTPTVTGTFVFAVAGDSFYGTTGPYSLLVQ